jgi:hypothetical protein
VVFALGEWKKKGKKKKKKNVSDSGTESEGVRNTELFSSLSPEHIKKLGAVTIADQIRFSRAVASVSEDSEFAIPAVKKRERIADAEQTTTTMRSAPLKRLRESSGGDIYMPDSDPRSTSLYQAISSYVSTRSCQEGLKRRSGEKAINTQIMKSGGEPNFVNKVMSVVQFCFLKTNKQTKGRKDVPSDQGFAKWLIAAQASSGRVVPAGDQHVSAALDSDYNTEKQRNHSVTVPEKMKKR